MKFFSLILLCFILLTPIIQPVLASNNFGEDEDYLGQVVDDYENDNNIASMINTINNETLNCMELNYSSGVPKYEDFEVYTEVDPAGKVVVNSPTLFTWNALTRGNDLTYVDEAYSVAYFGQNFVYSFNLEVTDAEAGDASDSDFIYIVSFGNVDHNPLTDPRITILIQQNGASDTDYYLYFRIDDVHAGWDFDLSILLDVAKMYHLILGRVNGDDLYLTINDEDDLLVDHLTVNLLNFDDDFRYISALHKAPYGVDMDDWISGTLEFLWNGSSPGGFYSSGSYYTVNVLDGDPAIAILYNLTMPAGTGATMEFSTDNATWVDHNNQVGSDTLIAGYESLDLRDIYNGTTYRRVNMTSNGLDTPRMWQERFVTVTEVDAGGTYVTGSIGIFLIALIIIAPIIYYLVRKR